MVPGPLGAAKDLRLRAPTAPKPLPKPAADLEPPRVPNPDAFDAANGDGPVAAKPLDDDGWIEFPAGCALGDLATAAKLPKGLKPEVAAELPSVPNGEVVDLARAAKPEAANADEDV